MGYTSPKNYHRGYYSNADDIEAIDIIESCHLNFHLGNVVKYVMRAGKKTPDKSSDYQKAEWYMRRLLETQSLLLEQYKALGPYFDKTGAIMQLTENDLLNDSLCSLLMINPMQDSYIEYKKVLTNLYYVLHTVIIEELNGGKNMVEYITVKDTDDVIHRIPVESIKEVNPVTDYTMHTPVKEELNGGKKHG